MLNKGFETKKSLNQTPSIEDGVDKPFNKVRNPIKKVDINILKARAKKIQDKENRKNISIFIFFLASLGAFGIYLSI